ncbi:MAG: CysZ protein [Gammaproteobacteria bacterium]|jgi:CysZ protein
MATAGSRELTVITAIDSNRLHRGASYAWQGFSIIVEPQIRVYVVIPLLINIAVFSLGLICAAMGISYVIDTFLPDWLDWLAFILWPIFALASLVIIFYGFTILANLIASPFNGLLAAAVEQHLTGQQANVEFSWRAMGREMLRTLGAELRKLAYFFIWAIPCLILFIIPGVNLIAAPLWFLFGAWMMAIEYIDCPLGNHGLPFPHVKNSLRARRSLALGFGGTVMFLTMIPIVNFIAMPVAVAGATALYIEQLSNEAGSV